MVRSDPLAATFAFEDFELDWPARELRKRGKRLRLPQQPLHILVLLVNAGGTVVTRDELRRALWQGATFVDVAPIVNAIIVPTSAKRRALYGADSMATIFITGSLHTAWAKQQRRV